MTSINSREHDVVGSRKDDPNPSPIGALRSRSFFK
jgi:hypothetical protein